MSRSVIDATRFTATSPHAYSKPSHLRAAASSPIYPSTQPRGRGAPLPPSSSPGKGTETGAQKVARLRAEHAAQKLAEISSWDRTVIRGRRVADAAHRFTTLGLIGLTVIATGVTVFSLGDMIVYNRKKRKAYFEEQKSLLQQSLLEAREAVTLGTVTEDQLLLLNRERAAEEAEQRKKNEKSMWKRVKGVFSTEGLKKDESESTLQALADGTQKPLGEDSSLFKQVVENPHQVEPPEVIAMTSEVMDGRREGGPRSSGTDGGLLDRLDSEATQPTDQRGSWYTWFGSK